MQVDADVGAVGDLEPEPLPCVAGPPGVDLSGLAEPVLGHRVGEADAVRLTGTRTAPGTCSKTAPTNELR